MEIRERKLGSGVNWQSALKGQRNKSWLISSLTVAMFEEFFTAVIYGHFYCTFAIA
jgi:hypothetical protein